MSKKRTTMDDIAKKLGVSKNAVSLALRGKDGVSDQLRSLVIETAASMQYPGVPQHTVDRCILALIPRYLSVREDGAFYQQVIFHMEAYAQSLGYQLIFSSVSEQEEATLVQPQLLDSITCAGVFTIGNLSLPYCSMINDLGLPYLMVDQYYEQLTVNSVTTTNTSGAYRLTTHLIENGHTEIEYFGKRYTTASLNDRWLGYSRAMLDHGLPVRRNLYQQDRTVGLGNDQEVIDEALRAMNTLPTAAVCGHDNTARDVIEVMARMGRKYPEDISLTGFDDIQTYAVQALNLTTYQTKKADIARAAIDLFLDTTSTTLKKIAIYGDVIYRGSVRNISK